MDHEIERRYFLERIMDFAQAIEEPVSDLQLADENRVLFLLDGRMFEVLAWIDAESDMICVTTRTDEMPLEKFEEAVQFLKDTMDTCWDYCVAVAPVNARYDLSMALYAGGFNYEAFEAVIYNLVGCAEAIEKKYEDRGGKKE